MYRLGKYRSLTRCLRSLTCSPSTFRRAVATRDLPALRIGPGNRLVRVDRAVQGGSEPPRHPWRGPVRGSPVPPHRATTQQRHRLRLARTRERPLGDPPPRLPLRQTHPRNHDAAAPPANEPRAPAAAASPQDRSTNPTRGEARTGPANASSNATTTPANYADGPQPTSTTSSPSPHAQTTASAHTTQPTVAHSAPAAPAEQTGTEPARAPGGVGSRSLGRFNLKSHTDSPREKPRPPWRAKTARSSPKVV